MKNLKSQATPLSAAPASRYGNRAVWAAACLAALVPLAMAWSVAAALDPMIGAMMALACGLASAAPERFREVVLWIVVPAHLAIWLAFSESMAMAPVAGAWSLVVIISYTGFVRRWYG